MAVARSRRVRSCFKYVVLPAAGVLFALEFLVYYVVLLQCAYPAAPPAAAGDGEPAALRAMFLADTHLLGRRQGHWFDKLRREWQMHRAFQTAMTYFRPELVVFLGDVFDEGKWAGDEEFRDYIARFRSLFRVDPKETEVRVVIGNHDVGFHYAVTPFLENRFERAFDVSSVDRFSVRGIQFVSVNSMAMEGDGCFLCRDAEERLEKVARELECAAKREDCEVEYDFNSAAGGRSGGNEAAEFGRPILLQHFPLHRQSDAQCTGEDAAHPAERDSPFRPKFDCLSEEATEKLLDTVRPRAVLSGHTHHGCLVRHRGAVPEWSVSSFSWRNRNNPTFLLARITSRDFEVEKCFMPEEVTVIFLYEVAAVAAVVVWIKCCCCQRRRTL